MTLQFLGQTYDAQINNFVDGAATNISGKYRGADFSERATALEVQGTGNRKYRGASY